MGSSSLIIAFVVAVWAAYFVPLVLRRYDEASKNHSVESTGSLSRTIARPVAKTSPVDGAASVVETSVTVESVAIESVTVESVTVEAAQDPRPARVLDRPAARLAARRRRRTLLTLVAATVVVGGLVGFGIVATYWIAAPVALIAAWLVACRIQVRGERGLAPVRVPRPAVAGKKVKKAKKARAPKSSSMDDEDTIIVSGQIEDVDPGRKHVMESVALESGALDDQIVIAVPSVSTTGEALWDPLPVTLPTYVTKPRAGRTVRTIDFNQAGAWTSGHIEGEDTELPRRADEPGEERRAVGH